LCANLVIYQESVVGGYGNQLHAQVALLLRQTSQNILDGRLDALQTRVDTVLEAESYGSVENLTLIPPPSIVQSEAFSLD
jgi:hypothetical protein